MRKDTHQEIEVIPLPEELLLAIEHLNSLILDSIKRDGIPVNSGAFDIDSTKMNGDLDFAVFIVRWVSRVDEVIKNLNIILEDLRSLPRQYRLLAGHPVDRYYLLLRTYFYEFYRFREIHSQVIKESASRGFIEKPQVAIYRKTFHDAFKEVIEMRNALVHGAPIWIGEKNFALSLHRMASNAGYGLKNIETGEITDVKEALEDSCNHIHKIFSAEGNKMSKLIQQLIQWHIQIASKPV